MQGKSHQTWNGQELDGFAHRSYLRFKFSINKHGPAPSDLPVPQQEPEGELLQVGNVLEEQAKSVSTFCPLIKKIKIICTSVLA